MPEPTPAPAPEPPSPAPAPAPPDGAAPPAPAAPGKEPPAPGAPATPPAEVTYELKLPDQAKLEAKALERTVAFAKAQGLAPDVAQKALELANAEVQAYETAAVAKHEQDFKVTWPEQVKLDPEIGGDKLEETYADAARARLRFFTPAFNQVLDKTGWGNHPEFVRGWARVGRAMRNDKLVQPGPGGGVGGTTEQDAADQLYPTTKGQSGTG
jgi:hypothetical protein